MSQQSPVSEDRSASVPSDSVPSEQGHEVVASSTDPESNTKISAESTAEEHLSAENFDTPSPAPVEPVPPAPEASATPPQGLSRLFDGCAVIGPMLLVVLWAGQAVSQWLGHESKGLLILADSIRNALGPSLAESTQPLMMPEFSLLSEWMGAGQAFLSSVIPVMPGHASSGGDLFTMLALLVLTLLTWGLARMTGDDRRVAFASGLVILVSAIFMDLPDVAGQALLASSLLLLSLVCLYRGWVKPSAPLSLLCGFALIVPATLIGGILALVIPLIASFLFLIWRGTFRRAGARDGALAFGVMLILFCLWGSWIAFFGGGREELSTQVYSLFLNPLMHAASLQLSWVALLSLALLWMPWTCLPVFLPWARVGSFIAQIYRNRTQYPGHGWMWCCLLTGIAALVVFDASILMLFLLMPLLAVLTARGILGLSQVGSRCFMLCIAALLIVVGIAFGIAPFESGMLGVPALSAVFAAMVLPTLQETFIHMGLFVVCGLLLWKLTRRPSAGGSLLVFAILMILLAIPLAWFSPVASESSTPVEAVAPTESVAPAEPTEPTAPTEAVQQPEAEVSTPEPIPAQPEAAPEVVPPAAQASPEAVQTETPPAQPVAPEAPAAPNIEEQAAPDPQPDAAPQATPEGAPEAVPAVPVS